MTRPTVDFGIDLGTTNSAIAVVSNGQAEVIKNNENQDITPSVVQISETGSVTVGRKAYEHLRVSAQRDAQGGFKRQMGKQQRYPFPAAGVQKTPEDLATELLKSLRADAETWAGEEVRAAAITVPTVFELAQCTATQRAAKGAGIEHAPLLQEPIAAGLAYGYQREMEDCYFLVYDLGGGTFDITLLQIREGRLSVVDHDGDNFLGGRDWDRRLSELFVERLAGEGYDIGSSLDHRAENMRLLQAQAEEEKVRLSRSEEVDVIFDGRVRDDSGRPVEAAIKVSRVEFEPLITSDVDRSIALTEQLLERHSLERQAVARLVLVGGPTLTPFLRQRLAERIGIDLETRIDPMTVVARGAALFAGTEVLPDELVVRGSAANADSLQLHLSYSPVSDDNEEAVGGRLMESDARSLSIELRRADGGWASGRLPIENGVFVTNAILASHQQNVFELSCFDASGTRVPITPDRIAITHGLLAGDPPLSRTISVVALNDRNEEALVPMLKKGTALPAVRERAFRTAKQLEPGRPEDVLNVHVVEGEYGRSDHNRHVGYLSITGEQIETILPLGTPVDVKLRVDSSRNLLARAYIPLIDLTIENVLQENYLPTLDPEELEADVDLALARAHDVAVDRADSLQQIQGEAREIQRDLAAGDQDAIDRADRRLKELNETVDRLDAETASQRLAGEIESELASIRELLEDVDRVDYRRRLDLLETAARKALRSGDAERMRHALAELERFYWTVAMAQPAFWVDCFIHIEDTLGTDVPHEADRLLARGRHALAEEDDETLRKTCIDLWQLLSPEEQAATGLKDIGIHA